MCPPSRRQFLRATGVAVACAAVPTTVPADGSRTTIPCRTTLTFDGVASTDVTDAVATPGGYVVAIDGRTSEQGSGSVLWTDEYGRLQTYRTVDVDGEPARVSAVTDTDDGEILVAGYTADRTVFVAAYTSPTERSSLVRLPERQTLPARFDLRPLDTDTLLLVSSVPTPSTWETEAFLVDRRDGTVRGRVDFGDRVDRPELHDVRVQQDGTATVIVRSRVFDVEPDGTAERRGTLRHGYVFEIEYGETTVTETAATADGFVGAGVRGDELDVVRYGRDGEVRDVSHYTPGTDLHSVLDVTRSRSGEVFVVGRTDTDELPVSPLFLADPATGKVWCPEPPGIDGPGRAVGRAFALRSGESLLGAGAFRAEDDDEVGWVSAYTATEPPTPEPTATESPTPTPTPTESPTPTPTETPSATSTPAPDTETTTTTTPGFSLATVAGALGLGAVELLRRSGD